MPAPPDEILVALQGARCKQDVRALQQRHGLAAVQAAWSRLDPLDRAALLLARYSDGTIFHDLDPDAFRSADPGSGQPVAAR